MHLKINSEFDSKIKLLEKEYLELIRQRLGIVMHSHQNYELFKTIQEACNRFNITPDEYLKQLSLCPDQSPFLDHLIAGITVGETYFFRDKQQMKLLENELLPEIIRNKREKNLLSIRIWSAGCATGEEIYSIAMILNEILYDFEKWTIKLLATDINTSILQKAITGIYTEWSMRSISDYYKNKYFQKTDRNYLLSQRMKELVNFDYLNLNDNSYPSIFNGTNAQDLIICRNVLIYIDNESCHYLMYKLNKSLIPGGYLMLGASDPVNVSDTDFIFHDRKTSLLMRPIEDKIIKSLPTEVDPIKAKPYKSTSKYTAKEKSVEKIVEPIVDVNSDLIQNAINLANDGKLEEAIKLCKEGFKQDPTNKLNYFTYGLAMSELNQLSEAESALRKTIFLDNQFVAGHFQLGLLLLRKNQHEAGLKSLKNALIIAESKQSGDEVPGSPGLCYREVADILRNEITLHMTTGNEYGN